VTDKHTLEQQKIKSDVAKFLASGGKIKKVAGFESVKRKPIIEDYDPAAVTDGGEELLTARAIMRRYGVAKYSVSKMLPKAQHKIKNPSCFGGNRQLNAWPKSLTDSIFLDSGSLRYSPTCTTISAASEYWGISKSEISDKVQRGTLPPFDGTDPMQFWTRSTWSEIPLHEHLKEDHEDIDDGVPIKDLAAEFGVNTYNLTKMMRNNILPPADGVMQIRNSSGNYYTCNAYHHGTAAKARTILTKARV